MATAQPSAMAEKLYISMDFGTTYSGAAFAHSFKIDRQSAITTWPTRTGVSGNTNDKVPTELVYEPGGKIRWGSQLKEGERGHRYFKLKLNLAAGSSALTVSKSQESGQRRVTRQSWAATNVSKNYPDEDALEIPKGKHVEDLVRDYLTNLVQHVRISIGRQLGQLVLQRTSVDWTITVPAIWTEAAKERTRNCAIAAGMRPNLRMISEPEAAAVFVLSEVIPHNLEIDDIFVVCDAGGGTCDLISYKILGLKPTLVVSEAAPGSGGLCGSSYLNRIFKKHMQDTFGDLPGWDEETLETALQRWDEFIKRRFAGLDDGDFIVPVLGLADNSQLNIRKNKFSMTALEVAKIFDPVVNEVIGLVREQIRTTNTIPATKSGTHGSASSSFSNPAVKAVLLVGGFGANQYLRDSLEKALHGIEIMQPPDSWGAIYRGGLKKAIIDDHMNSNLGLVIKHRQARKHYGINANRDFEENYDDPSKQFYEAFEGVQMVSAMHWIVKQGDLLSESKPFKTDWYVEKLASKGRITEHTVDIYTWDPPSSHGTSYIPYNHVAPIYPDDVRVTHLVRLTADLSRLPEANKVTKKTGVDGKAYYVLKYHIKIQFLSAGIMEYSLWYKGRSYGSVSAEYI